MIAENVTFTRSIETIRHSTSPVCYRPPTKLWKVMFSVLCVCLSVSSWRESSCNHCGSVQTCSLGDLLGASLSPYRDPTHPGPHSPDIFKLVHMDLTVEGLPSPLNLLESGPLAFDRKAFLLQVLAVSSPHHSPGALGSYSVNPRDLS